MECHESELRSAKEYIDKQLELLVAELNRTQEVLGDQQVELKKSKVYNESLENKNRVCWVYCNDNMANNYLPLRP